MSLCVSSEVAYNDGLDTFDNTNPLLSAFCFIVMQHKNAAKSLLQKLRKLKHTKLQNHVQNRSKHYP
jgi:arginine utilization protein RocB